MREAKASRSSKAALTLAGETSQQDFAKFDVDLVDLMKAGLPEIAAIDAEDGGNFDCTLGTPYANEVHLTGGSEEVNKWRVGVLFPGCFRKIRQSLGAGSDFATSISDFFSVGSGSGISGARHFLTKDLKYYIKTIPQKEVAILERGRFLVDYADHVAKTPQTLLIHMLATIRLRLGPWSTVWLLVMDNSQINIDKKKDSLISFDLKGSKWKHRITDNGIRRCSPLFPLDFWSHLHRTDEKDGNVRFEATGEDLDFYALRTQMTREWWTKQETGQKEANTRGQRRLFKDRLKKLPLNDECLLNKKTIKAEAGHFCDELTEQLHDAKEVLPKLLLKSGNLSSSVPDHSPECDSVKTAGWKNMLKEEKLLLEPIREYFGYPSKAGHDLERRPLFLEPTLRRDFTAQLEVDVALLERNNLLDYSMDLIIKYEPTDPNCSKVSNSGAPKTQRFTAYKGGMRAVGLGDEPAEKAIYMLRLIDFLAEYDVQKIGSHRLQNLIASNKVETRLPEIVSEIVSVVGTTKCKNLKDVVGWRGDRDAATPVMCWSSCMWMSSCSSYNKNLANPEAYDFVDLAALDFNRNLDITEMACKGYTILLGSRTRRSLCVAVQKGGARDALLKAIPLADPPSLPRALKGYNEETVQRRLTRQVSDELQNELMVKIHEAAPLSLRRTALMIYEELSRKPYKEDTIQVTPYAQRFIRYFKGWVSSPSDEDFTQHCANKQGDAGNSSSIAASDTKSTDDKMKEKRKIKKFLARKSKRKKKEKDEKPQKGKRTKDAK